MDEHTHVEVSEADEGTDSSTTSRRHLFAMGAAAVAGVAAVEVLSSQAADAATGGNMLIGDSNTVTTATDTTSLTGGFHVSDSGGPANRAAVTGQQLNANTNAHYGVQGITNTNFPTHPPAGGAGVSGVHNHGGPGVEASSTGGPQLYLVPGGASPPGLPATGQFFVASTGLLYFSFGAGAWTPLNSVVPLPAPVRLIDTTSGGSVGGIAGPLVPGATVHTSSAFTGGHGIPSNAVGMIGNFAISGVSGALLNGYGVATIYPAGDATPATANINAGAGCFAISNTVTVAFGTGGNAGKVSIVWNGGGPVPDAQAFFDITAYII